MAQGLDCRSVFYRRSKAFLTICFITIWGTLSHAAELTLTWTDNSDNETGFKIERRTAATTYSQVATVGANEETYTDTGLAEATEYWYQVRATNSAGDSGYTDPASAVTAGSPQPNTDPTISDVFDQTVLEDGALGPIAFTVGDAETPLSSLTLSATTSNSAIIPVSGITFGGSGADRTITITPAQNQSGSVLITVTVSDGELTASDTFGVTVEDVNDGPAISNLSNRSIQEDGTMGPIAFTIGDIDTSLTSLSLSGNSSNTALVPLSGIVFSGSGENRTVTVTPSAGQVGSTVITVTVSDGDLSASDTFTLTVTPAPETSFDYDLPSGGTVTLNAQDIGVVGIAGSTSFELGSGVFTIVAGGVDLWGTADGFHYVWHQASGDFTIVTQLDSLSNPHAYAKAGIMIRESLSADSIHATANLNPTGSANFLYRSATGGVTAADSASVTAPAWLKLDRLGSLVTASYSSDGSNWTQIGQQILGFSENVYVGLAATAHTTSDSITAVFSGYDFAATISPPANTTPTISDISDRTVDEDGSIGAVAFSVSDAETASTALTVTVSSSNTSLVPLNGIVLSGSGDDRTIAVTPAADQSGSTSLTLTVSDGELSRDETFTLNVNAINDAPTIGYLSNRTIGENESTGVISFSVTDKESTNASLTLVGVSSNQSLVPNSAIVFGGSSTNRTVTVTPVADQSGSSTIAVTVSDGDLSVSDSFILTVTAGPEPVTATIVSPVAGASFTLGDTVSGEALTSDIGRTETVEFYHGSTRINTERESPYNFNWTPNAAGSYVLKAVVTDTDGATTESPTINITITDSQPEPVTVALTSPGDGASFDFGDVINVIGSVSDESRVTRVELLVDGSSIGQDQNAPYVILWSGAEPGEHAIQLKATDSDGAVILSGTISVTVIPPPLTVELTNPAGDRDLEAGQSVRFEAVPSAISNTAKIEFLVDDVVIGTEFKTPYEKTWSSQTLGIHTVRAKAYDQAGAVVLSDAVTITITAATTEPTIVLTQPTAGARFLLGETVVLEADVDTKGATLSRVEYRVNGALVGQANSAPYSVDWVSSIEGDVSIVARAVVSGAADVNAAPVVVTVVDSADGAQPGVYRGSMASRNIGADLPDGGVTAAAESVFDGVFAVHVSEANEMTFLGFDTTLGIGLVGGPVSLPLDGSFSFSISLPDTVAALSGLPSVLTVAGIITSKGIEAQVEGTDLIVSGDRVTSTGPAASVQGLYELLGTRSTDTRILVIVGADGVGYAVRIEQGVAIGDEPEVALSQSGAFLSSTVLGLEAVLNPADGSADGILDEGMTLMGLRSDIAPERRLENISTRGTISAGDSVMITGFVVSGTEPKTMLIRAVGPGLSQFGVSGAVQDPVLDLVGDSGVITSNARWILGDFGGIVESAFTRLGAFDLDPDSLDAALLVTVAPGRYSAVVRDSARQGGNVLIEVYDATDDFVPGNDLTNLSTRGRVGNGMNLIGGFVVTGNVPKRVLIRGVGPGLAAYGIGDSLPATHLVLTQRVDGADVQIAENQGLVNSEDVDAIQTASESAGAFLLDPASEDSALLIWLEPGVYTAQVQPGQQGQSGTALVEVYQVN